MLNDEEYLTGVRWTVDFAGEELRFLRYKKQMTLKETAEQAGVSEERLDRVEQGIQPLDWEAVCRTAAVFDKRPCIDYRDMKDD